MELDKSWLCYCNNVKNFDATMMDMFIIMNRNFHCSVTLNKIASYADVMHSKFKKIQI